MSAESYLSRGVSPTKDEVKAAVKNQDKGVFPGAFCKLVEDLAGDAHYCTAIHADGAGTKSSLAYLMYKETGDLSYFAGIAQDSLVMNTDDLACVGVTDNFFLSNTIGRNAHRVSGAAIAEVIKGYDAMIASLKERGVTVHMTGGETADVGDLVQTLIVDSTVCCRIAKEDVISAANIKPGLAIVGLASFGQATYEKTENSGMGSNGLTAARHLLLHHDYYKKYPETYSSTISEDKVYCGPYHVEDQLPGSSMKVGEAILSPTRTYLPVLAEIYALYREQVVGAIHCTGGGQVKCRDFGKNTRYVKNNLFAIPPLFKAIYEAGNIPAQEMYQVFNMGHRLELYVPEELVEAVCQVAASFNIAAQCIGHTENTSGSENEVFIQSELGEFVY